MGIEKIVLSCCFVWRKNFVSDYFLFCCCFRTLFCGELYTKTECEIGDPQLGTRNDGSPGTTKFLFWRTRLPMPSYSIFSSQLFFGHPNGSILERMLIQVHSHFYDYFLTNMPRFCVVQHREVSITLHRQSIFKF